ncbi:Pseudouridine synthase [Elusimicrobium minutum Pei191]|uniref:Pseudouridine synthase n=1 Tax=Elusimicrobium minutum (strain Pei191) TaxID=445932 RepID=B2KBB0_ELUMP|nr:RluA family pseudouridine synthase [Elusimicrobium minutum]ACC97932.1 Pseudouridine synthase [Elusimicrobium minutum Pei191]
MSNKETLTFSGTSARLDLFLSENKPDYSRGLIQNLIKQGKVTVNGKERKPAWPLAEGDNVEIEWPSVENKTGLKDLIIFEDKNMFVINKPSGMLVHPQSPVWEENPAAAFIGEETLVSLILANPPKNFEKGITRAGLVHRLDKDTSGVMIIAKNSKTQDAMVEMFANREMHKTYEAIVCGVVPDDKGIINVPIGRVTGGKIKASELGREAVTEYSVLQRKETVSLMKLHPVTGRTNQLRVHMSWLGYPVLGDWLYKGATAPRLMLHSKSAEFEHPFTSKPVKFTVAPPKDFKDSWKNAK